jgi:CBS domain-containing protein
MTTTKEAMTRDLLTINASDSMVVAYRLMHEKRIRHLPVVDERQKVVGILSDRDIQRAMSVKRINNFQQEVELDATLPVEDFMSWPVHVVSEATSLRRVAEEMLSQKVSAFLVEDNSGRVKGIITTDDILKVFLMNDDKVDNVGMKAVSYYFTGPELL